MAGQTKTFTLPILDDHSWRIGIPYSTGQEANGASKNLSTVWSPALPQWTDEWLDTKGEDPKRFVQTKMVPPNVPGGDYTFEWKNISHQTIYYAGYAKDAPYERGPLFLQQERHVWKWKDDGRAWGGIGLAWRKVLPGQSVRFTRPTPTEKRPQRIGVRLYLTPEPRTFADACRPVWWPPFQQRQSPVR
ncbi:MAG TPA: hypothetical protein VHM91_20020 [Verrucomicrobiales bacterium]|nr:hypothetical protein [Verrucomicrobiales bacterium]